jgi:hypothetical protein
MEVKVSGRYEKGVIKINNRKIMEAELEMLGTSYDFIMTIQKRTRKRSVSQNSYFHGFVIPMVQDGIIKKGHKLDYGQTKDLLKMRFLKREIVDTDTGDITTYMEKTSNLTTVEFMSFIAEIQQWSAEVLDVIIPDPEEQIDIKF